MENDEALMIAARRDLVRQTKELKQLSEEEQNRRTPELFKSYQREIDSFGGMVKNARSIFKTAIEELLPLSDPLPIVRSCLEQTEDLAKIETMQKENDELRRALSRANLEVKETNAQVKSQEGKISGLYLQTRDQETTIFQLKSEIQTKSIAIDELNTALSGEEKRSMLSANKLQEVSKRNEDLNIELGRLKKTYEDLQKDHKALSEKKTQDESLKWAELDVVTMNLQSSRRQIVELQRENEVLRSEIKSMEQADLEVDPKNIRELENELSTLQSKLKEAERRVELAELQKDAELREIKGKLEAFRYDEKAWKELKILKAAEFPDTYNERSNQSLEALLQEKNKKLENDLVITRNAHNVLQEQLQSKQNEVEVYKQRVDDLTKVIERYEESTVTVVLPSEAASIKSASTEHLYTNDSIVNVLTNQRDRLKRQNHELEECSMQQVDSQRAELGRMQADNMKLFERIKFLEAFNNNGKKMLMRENVDSELGDLLHHYQPVYEEKLDPFRLFFQNVYYCHKSD